MKHQTICKELNINYKYYTKLRSKYKFFAYLTDILTLKYVVDLDPNLATGIIKDLKESLAHKSVFHGLHLALSGDLACFNPESLTYLRKLSTTVHRFKNV